MPAKVSALLRRLPGGQPERPKAKRVSEASALAAMRGVGSGR